MEKWKKFIKAVKEVADYVVTFYEVYEIIKHVVEYLVNLR
jgi:hypothetical protein